MNDLNIESPFGLSGVVDVFLIDKKTGEIVEHVRKRNQITEAFARWVLAGNMGNTNNASGIASTTIENNNINTLLSSKCRPDYQSTRCFASGSYGIYLLSAEVPVRYNTQIPPYSDSSLLGVTKHLACYGSSTTKDEGVQMTVNHSGCRWSTSGKVPGFTTTYMKTELSLTVRSIILGAVHGTGSTINVWQSPPIVPTGWSNTWTASSTSAMAADEYTDYWLVNPFASVTTVGYRRGTSIYAPGQAKDRWGYYDLAAKQFEWNSTEIASKQNALTGESYHTTPSKAVNSTLFGGIAVGNGRVVRVTKGATAAGSRDINFHYQWNLIGTTVGTGSPYIRSVTSILSSTTNIPESIRKLNSPVMVARPGPTPLDDVIDVFYTMGVVPYSGPGTTTPVHGFEIQRITINVNRLRTGSTADDMISSCSAPEVVGVLPFAIGFPASAEGTAAENPAGKNYIQGYYDEVEGEYYLPYTHLLKGMDITTWEFNPDTVDAYVPVYCNTGNVWHGAVFTYEEGNSVSAEFGRIRLGSFERDRDFLFRAENVNYLPAVTDEGLVPLAINTLQRFSGTTSRVISGVILDAPIVKTTDQILVVQYSYLFDIVPVRPPAPINFLAISVSPNRIHLTWELLQIPTDLVLQYRKGSSRIWTKISSVTSDVNEVLIDDLEDNCNYAFRLRAVSFGEKSEWADDRNANLTTLPIEKPLLEGVISSAIWAGFQIPALAKLTYFRVEMAELLRSDMLTEEIEQEAVWHEINVIAGWQTIKVTIEDGYEEASTVQFQIMPQRAITGYYNRLLPNRDYAFRLFAQGYHSSAVSAPIGIHTSALVPWRNTSGGNPIIISSLNFHSVMLVCEELIIDPDLLKDLHEADRTVSEYCWVRILPDGTLSENGIAMPGTTGRIMTFDDGVLVVSPDPNTEQTEAVSGASYSFRIFARNALGLDFTYTDISVTFPLLPYVDEFESEPNIASIAYDFPDVWIDRVSAVEPMTANSSRGQIASSSSEVNSSYPAYLAFRRSSLTIPPWDTVGNAGGWTGTTYTSGWLQIQLAEPKLVQEYRVAAYHNYYHSSTIDPNSSYSSYPRPKSWALQGSNDGTNWTTLHTVTNYSDWSAQNNWTYSVILDRIYMYQYYRLNITATHQTSNYYYIYVTNFQLISPGYWEVDNILRKGYGDWYRAGINPVDIDRGLGYVGLEYNPAEHPYPALANSDQTVGNTIIETSNTRDNAIAYLYMGRNILRIETMPEAPVLGLIGYSDTHTESYINAAYGDWMKTGQSISPAEYLGLEDLPGLIEENGGLTITPVANNIRNEIAYMFVGISSAINISTFGDDNVPDIGTIAFSTERLGRILTNIVSPMTSASSAGQVASTSSDMGSTWAPWKAFDGKHADPGTGETQTTGWHTAEGTYPGGVGSSWLQVDLGSAKSIKAFRMWSPALWTNVANATPAERDIPTFQRGLPKDFQLLGSNDGSTFITLKSVTGLEPTWYDGRSVTFELNTAVSYRYYRLLVTRNQYPLGQDYHPATVVFIGGLELLQESFAGQIPSLIPDTYGDWLKSGEFIINSIYPSLTGVAGITSGMIDSVLNSADGRIAYMFAGTNIRDIRYHTIAPAVGIIAYSFEDDSVLGIIKDYGDWARTGRTLSLAEYAGLDMVSGVSITANGGATINPVAPNAYSQTAFMFVGPSLAQYIPDFTEAPDLGTIAFAAGTNPLISYPYGDWVKTGITLSVDEYPQTDGLAGITGRVINPILNSGSGQTAYMFVGDNVLLIENITNFPELGSIAYSSANSDEIFNKPGIGTWFRAGRTISEGWYNMWLSSIPSRVEMVTDPLIPQMTTNTAPSPYVATASSVASNNNAYTAFRAFDRTDNYWQSSAAVRFDSVSYTPNAEWVKIDLNTAQQAISYKVTVFNNAACWPIYWVLEGSNYSSDSAPWTSLHIVGGSGADTAQPSWSSNETKTFEIPLAKQGLYQYYRLRITRVTTDGSAVQIKELQLIPATSYRIKPITGDTLGNLAYVFVISEESE